MIELKNITKSFKVARRDAGFSNAVKAFFKREYKYIHALKNISFKINDGEMVGYIGPNGAGKSSTIKIMSGILNPDGGECVINGRIPWKDRINHVKEIGVVFGQRSQLWWDVPVIDSFELIKDIYRTSADTYKNNLDELTEILDLSRWVDNPDREVRQTDGSERDNSGQPDDPLAIEQEGIVFKDSNDERSIIWYQSFWDTAQSRVLIERSLTLQGWQSISAADEPMMSFVSAPRGQESGGSLLVSFYALEEGCSILIELL